jgi:ABC-2 type transport system ATP-binding protein
MTNEGRAAVAAVALERVTKVYRRKVAVHELSLELSQGSFLGLLGRNGAGKSTTLKMVTGLVPPTSGTIRLLGVDLSKDPLAAKRLIGTMPEDMGLLDQLTGNQFVRFVGRMRGLDDATIDARRGEVFEMLDLANDAARGTLIADYSFGMKKKVALTAALLHGPRILFLDEPFEGIDPVTSRTIKELLLAQNARGVTIVLTTHILEVVEKLCPLVAILSDGVIKGYGTLDDLRVKTGETSLEALFVSLVGGVKAGSLSWI